MPSSNRQHTNPFLIRSADDETGHFLFPVPLRDSTIKEGKLQTLLAKYPALIPIDEIEPAMGPLICLGREVPTKAGPVDLLFVSPDGYLTLLETKLWRNPDARRTVVGQIIDYAKEFAQWSFADLDNAVRRSRQPESLKGKGIFEVVSSQGHDVDEALFVDTVSRNLARGQFLLIIAGDGIRRDVESMVNYLQNTPNLLFTLALIEMALFRFKRDEDWPLLVQPRIVAQTREVVRAIVEVKAPGTERVEVTLPDEATPGNKQRRRVLIEKTFYDELERNTDKRTVESVSELVESLLSLGLTPTWRASSVSLRLPDPGDSGKEFTIIILQTDGNFWLGYLSQISLVGYDEVIWRDFLDTAVRLTGAVVNKHENGTRPQNVETLLKCKEKFTEEAERYIQRIHAQAKESFLRG